MNKTAKGYLNQRATPWVSYLVLVGCICITVMLVYVSQGAFAIGAEWEGDMGINRVTK